MKNFQKILEMIAKENGTTPENVRLEMQQAIDAAYAQKDTSVPSPWDALAFEGGKPTPEAFVLQLAMMLDEGNGVLQ